MDNKTNSNYPWEIIDAPQKTAEHPMKYFTGAKVQYVYVGPHKYRFPSGFRQEAVKIYNMELRPDDVFVITFPRSGTTWTQELVWLIGNNYDYETAANKFLRERFPFLEITMIFNDPVARKWAEDNTTAPPEVKESILKSLTTSVVDVLAKTPSPRFIKSHLPFSLLPPGLLDTTKVVYVARNPRDVAVSYYYHCKMNKLNGFNGDFKTFWKFFLNGEIQWCPYFPHVKEAWSKRNHPNMLFLFYEELSKDLPAVVRRVAKFLNKPVTEEQVRKLCDHLHIDNFRKNKSVNAEELHEWGLTNKGDFIRKGKSGGWRDYFDEEMTQQAERWIEENLKDTDLRFPAKN